MTVDLDVVAELTEGDDGLQDLFAEGLLVEVEPGIGRFRHALIREACYREIPWSRRRAVHRQVAERLERRGSPAAVLAQHWLAARELDRAREALIGAMDAACAAHAYRDAAEAAQQALEVWPEGQAEAVRTAVLDRLGQCAQLSGDLAEAARAWREVSDTYTAAGELRRVAEVQRHLAAVYELQGSWSRALAAREAAAAAFAATGLPGEAAAERLAAAAHLRVALRLTPALELVAVAAREADEAGRIDLRARALGLEGNILARLGQFDVGLGRVRAGLQLALEHNLGAAAADVYQRLSDALEHSGDLAAAKQSYVDAAAFCQAQGADGIAQVCMACLTAVLRQTGEWDRCVAICREVLDAPTSPHARGAVLGVLGAVLAQRGEAARARRVLLDAERHAAFIELVPAELLATWGLAMVEELDGALDRAVERCRTLLERWRRTEDRHYSIAGLRWAASFLASRQAHADVRACASALAHIVTETGTAEAVAALGHALGEVSLLEGNAAQAQEHFRQAINQLDALELPYEAAHSRVRGGVALVAAGDRAAGVELLADGYRRARNLGARPLAASAARELTTLGEPVERRLGRRAAGMLEGGGLTRREQAVLRLVAEGHTDREIARILVLSPRTVEMHVANVLGKFGCRSRAEAVRRGAELGLLGSTVKAT
jgi:DNA-binding CsgD family transcriptional regulator